MTDPAGVPEVPDTVSVKVTGEPLLEGLGDDARLDVVTSALTTWVTTGEAEPV